MNISLKLKVVYVARKERKKTYNMLTKISIIAALVAASSSAVLATRRLGQPVKTPTRQWAYHSIDSDGSTHRRRRLNLRDDQECLLVLRDVQFEDHTIEEDAWTCELPHDLVMDELNGRGEFLDIDVPKDVIDSMNPTSGASVLRTSGGADMYIEENMGTREMRIHVPDDTELEVVALSESDERHHEQRRRNLADSSVTGTLSVLVLKVVDANGNQLDASNEQIVNDVFEDEFSLKTGYAQCSKDQLIIEPASGSGITKGVATVNVDIEASAGRNALQQEVLAEASKQFGNLRTMFDLTMICQPAGSGNWVAYAYINSWVSFYNNDWCLKASAQMHEVGHNLGLGHSNQEIAYGDQSGMLGYSYKLDDGPKMCFNAAKNYQLGWYKRMEDSFRPLDNVEQTVKFTLTGIDDYKTTGNTDDKLVTLRIVENGDDYDEEIRNFGSDYYVGFNSARGINSGTIEGRDQVLLFRKAKGGPYQYGESDRIADLSAGGSYKIKNFRDTMYDVTVRVVSISNGGRDANIEITTAPATVPCDGRGAFQLELQIDRYGRETGFSLVEKDTNKIIASAKKESHLGRQKYTYPSAEGHGEDFYCLKKNQCYDFTATDSWGDGMGNGEGYYVGKLDGNIVFQGGDFTFEISHSFCIPDIDNDSNELIDSSSDDDVKIPSESPSAQPSVEPTTVPSNSPSLQPTISPTKAPVSAPPTSSPTTEIIDVATVCVDDPNFLWKGREKKNCVWAGKQTVPKQEKKCARNNGDGKKVSDYCPVTCAKVGQGPCANIL